ncbi:MAG: hypothetical protein ACYC6A_24925 [Armatimonadota bacterium]
MRNGIARYFTGLLLACLLAVVASCARAQDAPTPDELFNAKEYPAYLAKLDIVLRDMRAPKLEKLAAVAIALQRTGGWNGAAGEQARELLAKTEAARYLEILHEVLDGNLSGVEKLFPNGPQPPAMWNISAAAFREHGYPLAAAAMEAMSLTNYSSESVAKAITAWQSIPREQRDPFDRRIIAGMEQSPLARRNIPETALQLFARPPAPVSAADPTPRDYFNLFLQLGDKAGLITIDTASRLRQYGKPAEAKEVALKAVALFPADEALQIDAAYFFAVQMQDPDKALQVYEQALKTVPDPASQSVRLSYLQFLERAQCTDEIEALTKHADPLLAATALFFSRKFDKAGSRYRAVLDDRKQPIGTRLAALSGLRMVNGGDYLKKSAVLLEELAKLDPDARKPLLRWLGQNLWGAVDSSINISGKFAGNTVLPGYRLPDLCAARGWEKQVEALLDRLLALDAPAVLLHDNRAGHAPRLNIASIYAVVHRPDKAVEVVQRRIPIAVAPAPGVTPTTTTSPQDREVADLMVRLESMFADGPIVYPEALTLVKPIATAQVRQISADTGLEDILRDMAGLAAILRDGATALSRLSEDPQQPLPLTGVELLEIYKSTVREAMTGEAQARASTGLIRNGLLPVLLTTREQKAFDLLCSSLTRYGEVTNAGVAAGEADFLAKIIENSADPATTDYGRQLREKFPKAQQ